MSPVFCVTSCTLADASSKASSVSISVMSVTSLIISYSIVVKQYTHLRRQWKNSCTKPCVMLTLYAHSREVRGSAAPFCAFGFRQRLGPSAARSSASCILSARTHDRENTRQIGRHCWSRVKEGAFPTALAARRTCLEQHLHIYVVELPQHSHKEGGFQ